MVVETSTGGNWHGLEIISRGANRLCARDPRDPAHCLKFELPPSERTRVGLRQRMQALPPPRTLNQEDHPQ